MNKTAKHKVYLMFTRTNTLLSKAIYKRTKEPYTHVAISLDDSLNEFYSFGRRYTPFMLPAGFAKESPFLGVYEKNPNTEIKIIYKEIDEYKYRLIKNKLTSMYQNRKDYKYDIIGILLCNKNITFKRDKHKFCSQFVSEILSMTDIVDIKKDVKHIRPSELYFMKDIKDGFSPFFEGSVYELMELGTKNYELPFINAVGCEKVY
ncbi:hypothetical protein [Anaerofustis sp.]|uniref:hypothetical protein n=1 Tax=Anaerofustis sp. TaxID=1872517 RepID=UPI0025BCC004|nr:hypothetical protein [Anaerofustis sp.]